MPLLVNQVVLLLAIDILLRIGNGLQPTGPGTIHNSNLQYLKYRKGFGVYINTQTEIDIAI